MKIGLVINHGFMTTAVTGMIDVFQMAQNTANRLGIAGAIQWQLIGVDSLSVSSGQGITFDCQRTLANVGHLDAVVFNGYQDTSDANLLAQADQLAGQLPNLLRLFLNCQYVVAGCNAVAVLGKLGLLDGKHVTSSWWLDKFFAQHCPRVTADTDQALVVDGKFITGGATLSFLSIACYLIEQAYGDELADYVSRFLLIERQPIVQSRYKFLAALPAHHDKVLKQVEQHVLSNLRHDLSLHKLAQMACVSERTLIRKFKKNLAMTPKQFIQQARIELCCRLLSQTDKTIEQIALSVGYQNSQALQKIFLQRQGQSMSAYRQARDDH
ncbi:GlxA family transcriptional regulator [Salinibius halmophilus]|uniref:GlxA family transcriptional regulator n=1 Tax=Salinibius halmophilus TaxID=1853216 RepID=UPI000E664A39|nr:helix-turn-helix domain-containing protein [Salinibius halmophilus]